METSSSIYSKRNPKIQQLFEQAGSAHKILCAPIDFAKRKHLVLFCNGLGDILKKAFPVENSAAGLAQLLDELHKTCHHRNISLKHVFLGGEDLPDYAENFIYQLKTKKFLVVRVNAWEAKKQRDNYQATTDRLDLVGIAKCMLQHQAYLVGNDDAAYKNLRESSRNRAAIVAQRTEVKNRMHRYVERLFPGFLGSKSGIPAFSQASLGLMSQRFSAPQIARRRRESLITALRRHQVDKPEEAAATLQKFALEVLPPEAARCVSWQNCLEQQVTIYRSLDTSTDLLERELAYELAMGAGAFLTSIRGVGIVLASGIMGELGTPAGWRGVRRLCSYCGIVPRTYQTGGPDQAAKVGRVQRRCNRRAKNWLVQCAVKMGEMGPEPLRSQYASLEAEQQHADFVMSKRLLRIMKDLLRRQTVYRPKALLCEDVPRQQLAAYYLELWPLLRSKWAALADLSHVFAPSNPLGQWRAMVQEMYEISLPLRSERVRAEPTNNVI